MKANCLGGFPILAAALTAWSVALFSAAFAAQTNAPQPMNVRLVNSVAPRNAGAAALEQEELEIDKQHLRQIYQAIQAYRAKYGALPNWLSDLVPDFLPDTNVLISPVELRTGRSVLWGYDDPRVKSSYIYEFNQSAAGGRRDQDTPLRMKQWKELQMEEFGPVIPMLRCHLYEQVLNISYSGELYQTGLFWETDTNTLALMARLGPGPGAKEGRKLRLTVLDAATGRGLPGAEVNAVNRASEFGDLPPRHVVTDGKGECEVNLGGKKPKGVNLKIGKADYANAQLQFGQGEIPEEASVKLEKAVGIGGLVRDAGGKPIPGVTIVINGLTRDPVGQVLPVECDSVTTDASGKWASRRVPANFEGLNFKLSHPEFMPAEYDQATAENANGKVLTKANLLAGTAALQMEPGIEVRGTVRDPEAKGVAGALVVLVLAEEDRRTTKRTETDSAGHFRLVLTETGNAKLVVEAPGFAPGQATAEVQRGVEPLVVNLDKGWAMKGRVVDGEGKPLAGVNISVPSFNDIAPLKWGTQSDADGNFSWPTAPKAQTVLQFSKPGFVESYQPLPQAGTAELSVVMDKPFSLSGTVVDADTGEPIKSFVLTPGYSYDPNGDYFDWDRYQTNTGTNGRYSVVPSDRRGPRIKYMVTADSYLPESTPTLDAKGAHTFDFKLKHGEGLSGVVQLASGQPVAGATVILAEKRDGAYMDKCGAFREGIYQNQRVLTDEQGRFKFQPRLEAHTVLVAAEQGFAQIRVEKLAADGRVVLQPWGRVKGTVKVGQPMPNRSVALNSVWYRYGEEGRQFPALSLYLKTEPNEDGTFEFEKVPPGDRKLFLQYKFHDGPGVIPLSHGTYVQVKPGETIDVTLGGTGRPVVGRVQASGPEASEVDWTRDIHTLQSKVQEPDVGIEPPYGKTFASNEERQKAFTEYAEKQRAYWTSDAGRARERDSKSYVLVFAEDGSFRVDAVPPGTYTLGIAPTKAEDDQQRRYGFMGRPLGNLSKEIVVPAPPAGKPDEPFDLGTLELKLNPPPTRRGMP